MNLFEISQAFVELRDMEADVDPDVFADTMEDIEASLDEKIDAYHAIISDWAGKVFAIDEEIHRLQKIKKSIENRRLMLNENLMICLNQIGEREHKTKLNKVRIQANPLKVVLDVDPQELPDEYWKIDIEADKKKIASALKLGKDMSGLAHFEQTEGVRWS